MLAVGRDGMLEDYPNTKEMTEYNFDVLNQRSVSYDNNTYTLEQGSRRRRSQLSHRQQQSHHQRQIQVPPIFECGEGWVEEAYYKKQQDLDMNYYGDIVPSMINFWLAVEADVFVGVMKSSYSNDVWTTRYHLGKGRGNYQYTQKEGVVPIPNNGLPRSHQC